MPVPAKGESRGTSRLTWQARGFVGAFLYGAVHGQGGTGAGSTEAGRVDSDQTVGFTGSPATTGIPLLSCASLGCGDERAASRAVLRRGSRELALPRAALHINGGGTATREDAEHDALSAITFALEGDPQDYDTDAESLTFDVNVAPAA